MSDCTAEELIKIMYKSKHLVFMTGAGVSTPSGIPDYRSMTGIYTKSGLKRPEYLLSHHALFNDTDDFYSFIKQIYHPNAEPNVIHRGMALLGGTIITQNIDGLHKKAGSRDVIEFHGTIYYCHCEKCKQSVPYTDFLKSYIHKGCGGIVRPDIVLYDEQINSNNIENSISAITQADIVIIVGTTFQVYPFAGLIQYANKQAKIYAINRDPVKLPMLAGSYIGDASDVFKLIKL